jgi:hypothetical protein
MGKLYVFGSNAKGGVGKSSMAVNVAGAYAHKGYKVALVDTDIGESNNHSGNQGSRSLSNWVGFRKQQIELGEIDGPEITSYMMYPDHDIQRDIKRLLDSHDIVIVDSPGSAHKALQSMLVILDHLILPTNLTLPELLPLRSIYTMIGDIESSLESLGYPRKIKASILGCKIDSRWKKPWESFDYWYPKEANRYFSTFKVVIPLLQAYTQTLGNGLCVHDKTKTRNECGGTIERFIDELEGKRSIRHNRVMKD